MSLHELRDALMAVAMVASCVACWMSALRASHWKRIACDALDRSAAAAALLKRWMTWSFKLGVASPVLDEIERDTDEHFTEQKSPSNA